MDSINRFKSKYFSYDLVYNQLNFFWTEESNNISEKSFFLTVKKVSELIKYFKPECIYVDFHNISLELSNINHVRVFSFVIPAFLNAKVKKLAVYVGEKDVIKTKFISKLLEKEDKKIKFTAKTFKDKHAALKWLK